MINTRLEVLRGLIVAMGTAIGIAMPSAGQGVAFKALHSGKCLATSGNLYGSGVPIVQATCTGRATQLWRPFDGTYFSLVGTEVFMPPPTNSIVPGKVIAVKDDSLAHAAPLALTPMEFREGPGPFTDTWQKIDPRMVNGIEYSRWRNLGSSRCMDVAWASQDDDAQVVQADCNGGDNQFFAVVVSEQACASACATTRAQCLSSAGSWSAKRNCQTRYFNCNKGC